MEAGGAPTNFAAASRGSSTCSSTCSTSSKGQKMVDIWKQMGEGLDVDEGLGESPINIWSLAGGGSPAEGMMREGKRECLMCGEKEVTHALVPCGHNMFCGECAGRLFGGGDSCPMCSKAVNGTIRILV